MDWQLGQIHHNWTMQRRVPRTAREAFGHSLDADHRDADHWVFWVVVVCTGVALLLLGCGQ